MARGSASSGGHGSGCSVGHGTRGGLGGSMSSFAGRAVGVGPLVIRLASVVDTNGQVVEVVLPTAKQILHIL